MKKLIVTLALIAIAKIAIAQNPCYIKYTYDASGNRIKREFICAPVDSTDGSEEHPGGGGSNFRMAQNNAVANFDFNIHPNPTKATFTLEMSSVVENAMITLYNNVGQQLQQFNTSAMQLKIDIATYNAGIYFVCVQTSKEKITKKIVKE